MHLLFVYGSLKRGCYNSLEYRWSGYRQFIRESKTAPDYTMISLGAFPAVLPDGSTSISGEIWEIDDEILGDLDRMELGAGYTREIVTIDDQDVFLYVRSIENLWRDYPIVEDGHWKER